MLFDHNCLLSIDIGTVNLGYTTIVWPTNIDKPTLDDVEINFKVISLNNTKLDVVHNRIDVLHELFTSLITSYNLLYVVVERQVTTNVVAMCIMYSISSLAICYEAELIIFDPKLKFNILNVPYTTTNKSHKKQSISYAQQIIRTKFNNKLDMFMAHTKKDDISDSLNQGLLWLIRNNKMSCTVTEIRDIIFNQSV